MKNNDWTLALVAIVTAVWAAGAGLTHADEADAFFDDSFVHEIHITFADPDWYDTLYASHANDPDDPYIPAAVECDGVAFDPVGVRFKGNSSFGIPGVKKSFKIDFNEYDDDTTFVGLKKLNLNNGFKDPTMMRAKLFLDFAGAFVPAVRACIRASTSTARTGACTRRSSRSTRPSSRAASATTRTATPTPTSSSVPTASPSVATSPTATATWRSTK